MKRVNYLVLASLIANVVVFNLQTGETISWEIIHKKIS